MQLQKNNSLPKNLILKRIVCIVLLILRRIDILEQRVIKDYIVKNTLVVNSFFTAEQLIFVLTEQLHH